jgi:hypothetical protein
MKRLIAAALALSVLPAVAFLTASRPALPGPGAVLETQRALFAALDRGDAQAAERFFTRSKIGLGIDPSGKFTQAPGALYFVPGDAEHPARALAERFKGGTTRIVGGWSDCTSGEVSWAALELEHTPADGRPQRWHSTALVRHEDAGMRLYLWHLAPAAATTD